MRDLNRQLGTPSHGLPVDSCKKRTKGRPSGRLHSEAQVSQQETPKLGTSVSEHRVLHSEGGKKNCVVCVYSRSGKPSLPSPLSVTSRLEQATRVSLENLPKVPTPFPTFSALFKLPKHLKRLKALLITNVTCSLKRLIRKRSAFKTLKCLGAIIVPERSKRKLY